MKKLLKTSMVSILGVSVILLSGCAKSEVTDTDIAEHLKPMTAATETNTPIKKTDFCKNVLQYYGEYGQIVSERAKIQSESGSGNYSEEDIYNNVTGQQDVVQKMEDYTAKYSVTDNPSVEKARQDLRTPSQNLVKAYNKSREDKTLKNLDNSIIPWGNSAQALAMTCAS